HAGRQGSRDACFRPARLIVEFVGLPGAGKSSLEAALVSQATLAGGSEWGRRQLVERLISEYSGLPRNGEAFVRRASTALYKFRLISDCLMGRGMHARAGDLVSRHRLRALMRIAEDIRLHRSDRVSDRPSRCL